MDLKQIDMPQATAFGSNCDRMESYVQHSTCLALAGNKNLGPKLLVAST